ncbi:hypothetical protein M5K25_015870 [Dendrobium thyrsiflorum]|uniref:Uncharacterized protein n=1 Tax=Dendrobium thyrsiflorum TaxID=117978 RepID=A0ABD0URF8_DENTH
MVWSFSGNWTGKRKLHEVLSVAYGFHGISIFSMKFMNGIICFRIRVTILLNKVILQLSICGIGLVSILQLESPRGIILKGGDKIGSLFSSLSVTEPLGSQNVLALDGWKRDVYGLKSNGVSRGPCEGISANFDVISSRTMCNLISFTFFEFPLIFVIRQLQMYTLSGRDFWAVMGTSDGKSIVAVAVDQRPRFTRFFPFLPLLKGLSLVALGGHSPAAYLRAWLSFPSLPAAFITSWTCSSSPNTLLQIPNFRFLIPSPATSQSPLQTDFSNNQRASNQHQFIHRFGPLAGHLPGFSQLNIHGRNSPLAQDFHKDSRSIFQPTKLTHGGPKQSRNPPQPQALIPFHVSTSNLFPKSPAAYLRAWLSFPSLPAAFITSWTCSSSPNTLLQIPNFRFLIPSPATSQSPLQTDFSNNQRASNQHQFIHRFGPLAGHLPGFSQLNIHGRNSPLAQDFHKDSRSIFQPTKLTHGGPKQSCMFGWSKASQATTAAITKWIHGLVVLEEDVVDSSSHCNARNFRAANI